MIGHPWKGDAFRVLQTTTTATLVPGSDGIGEHSKHIEIRA